MKIELINKATNYDFIIVIEPIVCHSLNSLIDAQVNKFHLRNKQKQKLSLNSITFDGPIIRCR